jgi:hypothetical protein
MLFNDLPRLVTKLNDMPEGEALRGLPQFFRADLDMVWRLGGPSLRRVLSAIGFASRWQYLSVDSRLHMLMPGMYPCIPGWHCDDFHRPDGKQPALAKVMHEAPSEHAAIVLGGCSLTRFVNEPITVDVWTPAGANVYGKAHALIEALEPRTMQVAPGELWWFSPLSWHRGEPATARGWRYFLRITGSNHYEPRNELRTQTQVYMPAPFEGW